LQINEDVNLALQLHIKSFESYHCGWVETLVPTWPKGSSL